MSHEAGLVLAEFLPANIPSGEGKKRLDTTYNFRTGYLHQDDVNKAKKVVTAVGVACATTAIATHPAQAKDLIEQAKTFIEDDYNALLLRRIYIGFTSGAVWGTLKEVWRDALPVIRNPNSSPRRKVQILGANILQGIFEGGVRGAVMGATYDCIEDTIKEINLPNVTYSIGMGVTSLGFSKYFTGSKHLWPLTEIKYRQARRARIKEMEQQELVQESLAYVHQHGSRAQQGMLVKFQQLQQEYQATMEASSQRMDMLLNQLVQEGQTIKVQLQSQGEPNRR